MHFINASNHKGYKGAGANLAPSIVSYPWGGNAAAPAENPKGGEAYFADWDKALHDPAGTVMMADAFIKKTGQNTEMVLNEFMNSRALMHTNMWRSSCSVERFARLFVLILFCALAS